MDLEQGKNGKGLIFVIGLMHRVGTNYLAAGLASHPSCTRPSTLHEDFLLSELKFLDKYVDRVQMNWDQRWNAHERVPKFKRLLGHAHEVFIWEDAMEKKPFIVLKTPEIHGIKHVRSYLPASKIIALTRFGPAVVESGMRGFKWSFEQACERWGKAVSYLLEVLEEEGDDKTQQVLVVQYEKLLQDPTAEYQRILDFTGLEASKFDVGEVEKMPIIGSSTHRGGEKDVHWAAVEKTKDFNPLSRADGWSTAAYDRFDWLTRSVSTKIGYDLPVSTQRSLLKRWSHQMRDQKCRLPRRIQHRLRYQP